MSPPVVQLIQADLNELLTLREEGFSSPELNSYLEILISYYKGEAAAIRRTIQAMQESETSSIIRKLGQVRAYNLERRQDLTLLKDLIAEVNCFQEWQGEAHFVAATMHFDQEMYSSSAELFLIAKVHLMSQGAFRKALKAEATYIVALSWMDPQRNLVAEYDRMYREARRLGERVVATNALMNIAREYHKLGAIETALRMNRRALAISRHNWGAVDFYECLAQHCHLLIDLHRLDEARSYLDKIRTSPHGESQEAIRVLESRLNETALESLNPQKMSPPWKERMERAELSCNRPQSPTLSPQESLLLDLLRAGPQRKTELQNALFGMRLSQESRDARFKSLIERLRKKAPHLVTFEDGNYVLQGSRIA